MRNKRFFILCSIALIGMSFTLFKCANSTDTPTTGKSKKYDNCKLLTNGQDSIKTCFAAGEIITNTTDYTTQDETALFEYLNSFGLIPIDTCACEEKLIRWGPDEGRDLATVDVTGIVIGAQNEGKPSGDSLVAVSPNFSVSIPEPLGSFISFPKPVQPNRTFPDTPRAKIVVIDTGVDTLNESYITRHAKSFASTLCHTSITDTEYGIDITDIPNPLPDDLHGHGTHVAGIATDAMIEQPLTRISLRSVKVSEGDSDMIHVFSVLCAMYYALEKDFALDGINCSLVWQDSAMLSPMIPLLRRLDSQHIFLVAGAGNEGIEQNGDSELLSWPAGFSNASNPSGFVGVFSVGAWNSSTGTAWERSNWGDYVDVFASGVDILSTFPVFEGFPHGTAKCTGTSMAAPLVVNRAAKIKAQNPGITLVELKSRIFESTDLRVMNIGTAPDTEVRVLIDP